MRRHWVTVRNAAGQLGHAVAERVYPRAKTNGQVAPLDYLLPDGGHLEAKAANSRQPVHVSQAQLEAMRAGDCRLIVTVYDLYTARSVEAPSTFAAIARSVMGIVDVPGEYVNDVMSDAGQLWPWRMLESALTHPDATIHVPPRLIVAKKGRKKVQASIVACPLVTLEQSPHLDFCTWRQRKGLEARTPF